MDSKELSSISDCFGDQIINKNTKTYTKWLKLLSRVLNMPIELKGQNYYSKVFKRINYRLSNSTFWVVIIKVKYRLMDRVLEYTRLHMLMVIANGDSLDNTFAYQ